MHGLGLRVARLGGRLCEGVQRLVRVLVGRVGQGQQRLRRVLRTLAVARLGLAVQRRVEAHLEQPHQQRGQQRVAAQRVLGRGLGEGHAGLQQVLGVAAQHRDLAPAQAGTQHQAVEAVVLGIAAPDAGEGLVEILRARGHVDVAAGRLDLELLDVGHAPVQIEAEGMLGDHAQAHVLHQRQRVGQRDVDAQVIEIQAQRAFAGTVPRRAVQAQAQIVGVLELGQALDVVGGQLGGDVLDVVLRQRPAEAGRQRQSARLAVALDQRLAQVVLPVAQQMRQARLQLGRIDADFLARARAHGQVQLRQRRFAQLHGGVDRVAVQGLLHQRLDAQAQLGVEAVARHVDQRRPETPVAIAAQEQLAAHALLQAQDAHRGARQLVLARLEQFLARQRLQDMAQRLAAMAVGRQAGLAHDVLVALAHQRDLPRAAVVGAGGEQAQEALLAGDAAVGVEGQHADVVHVTLAMHRGARIGLGQDHRLGLPGLVEQVGGQRAHRARLARGMAPHQAQAGVLLRHQHFLAALLLHAVLAIAEEGEVVVGGPLQEFLRLAAHAIGDRHAARGQVLGHGQHLLAHRAPVADDLTHLGQHAADLGLDARHRLGRLAVDLQHHQRLGLALAHRRGLARLVALEAHHRMAQHMHAHAHAGQGHAHRIDQEGHVVVDDLQHRVRGLPAVGLGAGVEHAHVGRAGLAHARELQHVHRHRRPALRAVVRELVPLHAPVEGIGEDLGLLALGAGHQRPQGVVDGLQRERGGGCAGLGRARLGRGCGHWLGRRRDGLGGLAAGLAWRGRGGLGGRSGFFAEPAAGGAHTVAYIEEVNRAL